ncbi:MAG: ABC transporter permease [Bacteroidales bacterium]|nr:ABC transporter permease [Bacteroidales bacterium]
MSYERLIARRFLQRDKNNFSRPLVNIATYTIALGVVVMIMAICILRGFQHEITNKVIGFGAHINIRSYAYVNDYDEAVVTMTDEQVHKVAALPLIDHIQPVANKGGMLKTDDQIQGIVFKGVDRTFDTSFFASNLIRGHFANTFDSSAANEIIISQRLAQKMHLDTGDKARTYFWAGNTYRPRAFRIVGIYNTDLSEFDDHYIIGNISQLRTINRWDTSAATSYEVIINNFKHLDQALNDVKSVTRSDLAVTSIVEEQPSMFAWLQLLNSNIALILIIMAVVCSASVVSALLIMIFEKTSMIGLLKTLGSTNSSIRRIFILKAISIVGKGIFVGNIIAIAFCLMQQQFHIIRLDSESYSMTFVPIDANPLIFILVSAGTFIVASAALLIPATYISHIDPAKTTRQE